MNPQSGQHVKIIFKDGFTVEGKVAQWTNKQALLESGEDKIIIQDLSEVIIIKIYGYKHLEKQVYINEDLKPKERDLTLRGLQLADLRTMRAREERERARELLRTFKVSENTSFAEKYGYPTKL